MPAAPTPGPPRRLPTSAEAKAGAQRRRASRPSRSPPALPQRRTEEIKVTTAAEASSAATRLLELATRNADEVVAEAKAGGRADRRRGPHRGRAPRGGDQDQDRQARAGRPHPAADPRLRDRDQAPRAARRPGEGEGSPRHRGREPACLRAGVPQPAEELLHPAARRRSTAAARAASCRPRRLDEPKRLQRLRRGPASDEADQANRATDARRGRAPGLSTPDPARTSRGPHQRGAPARRAGSDPVDGEGQAQVGVALREPLGRVRLGDRGGEHLARRSGRGARRSPRATSPVPSWSSTAQLSAIRSETSKPLVLRASWTIRITSRARPARRSSGVSSRSSATVSPCSLTTDQPSRGRSETITSSGSTSTGVAVERRRVARPSAARAAASALGVGRGDRRGHPWACPWRTACRGPGSCPWRVWSTRSAPAADSGSSAPMFSSSATSPRSSSESRSWAVVRDQGPAQRLAGAHLGLGAGGAAELDQPPGQPHLLGQVGVDQGGVLAAASRTRCTDSGRSLRRVADEHVPPDPLGDERRQRGHQLGDDVAGTRAGSRRRRRRRPRSGGASGVRTSWTGRRRTPRAGCPARWVSNCSIADGDLADQPVRLGERPPVQHGPVGRGAAARRLARRPAGRGWRRARGRRRCSSRSAGPCGPSPGCVVCPTRRAAHGDPPAAMNQRTASAPCSSISGIGSRMLPRCLDILRPSSARMWPEAQHVAVRRLVEDQRADGHQRVEPAAGLVDRLADEVGRVGLLEHLAPSPRRAGSPTARTASSRSRTSASITSGTRRASLRRSVGQGKHDVVDVGPVRVEARTGRRRSARRARPASRRRSGGPRAQRQIGSGVPQ